jgi:hypothetical protein
MKAVLILKDPAKTAIMHSTDIFPEFKFIGSLMDIELKSNNPLHAKELLKSSREVKNSEREVVGLIIPGHSAAILECHTILSNGNRFVHMADILNELKVPQGMEENIEESACS